MIHECFIILVYDDFSKDFHFPHCCQWRVKINFYPLVLKWKNKITLLDTLYTFISYMGIEIYYTLGIMYDGEIYLHKHTSHHLMTVGTILSQYKFSRSLNFIGWCQRHYCLVFFHLLCYFLATVYFGFNLKIYNPQSWYQNMNFENTNCICMDLWWYFSMTENEA